MNVVVRVPCRAGSAWNSGAWRTVKFGSNVGSSRQLGADEHVPNERHVPRVRRDVAHRQAIRRICAAIEILDEQLAGLVQVVRARPRAAARISRRTRLVDLAPVDVILGRGSFTTNLSFGERPVCGVVTATNGPMSANSPSLRRAAAFISSGAIKFQWTSPRRRQALLAQSNAALARRRCRAAVSFRLPSTHVLSSSRLTRVTARPSPRQRPCSRCPERRRPARAHAREDSYPRRIGPIAVAPPR